MLCQFVRPQKRFFAETAVLYKRKGLLARRVLSLYIGLHSLPSVIILLRLSIKFKLLQKSDG